LILLGLLPGLGALNAPLLTAYDDKYATLENPVVRRGWEGFRDQCTLPFRPQTTVGFETAHWAPLSFLSLALDHLVFGRVSPSGSPAEADFTPWGFRLMAGLYHGLCAWLILRAGRRLTGNLAAALFGALVFLFHPTVCETVCWIVERHHVLAALFGLWALDVYTGGSERGDEAPSWRRMLAAAGLLLVAQFCKAYGMVWWAVIVGWDVLFFRRSLWPARLCRAALLALPLALTLYVARVAFADAFRPPLGEGVLGPWVMSASLLVRYLGLVVWPVNLSAFYHVSPRGPDWLLLGAGAAGVVAGLGWARWAGVPWRRLVFYGIWIASGVAPVISPFTSTSFLVQDRYLYCAMPGFGFFLAEALCGTGHRLRQPVLRWAGGGLLGVCLALSLARGLDWRGAETLFADAARKQPQSAFGHSYLANYLFHASAEAPDARAKAEMLKRAQEEYERSLACDDFDRLLAPLWVMDELASLRYSHGDLAGARELFGQVWKGRAEWPTERGAKLEAVRFLAFDALSLRGQPREGLRFLEEGLRLNPEHPELLANRLRAWSELGETEKVRLEAERLANHPRVGPVARELLAKLPPAPPPVERPPAP
jgi:tetratricopeptide (TPR) repeat protein